MKQQSAFKQSLRQTAVFLILLSLALLASRQVNTWLGMRALENTGLQHLQMQEALQRSQETGRPVLAKFAAIWCGACRQLDKRVFSDKAVKKLLDDNVYYVRLEYEDENDRQWFTRYGVGGFPRLALFDGSGELIGFLRTPSSAGEFIEVLRQLGDPPAAAREAVTARR